MLKRIGLQLHGMRSIALLSFSIVLIGCIHQQYAKAYEILIKCILDQLLLQDRIISPQSKMALCEITDKDSYISHIDLDYESFLKKKITKCGDCGDIYYSRVKLPHPCMMEKQLTIHLEGRSSVRQENIDQEVRNAIMSIGPPVSICLVHDEIYAIWAKNKYPRRQKGPVPQRSINGPKKENYSGNFSFSPYDNFF